MKKAVAFREMSCERAGKRENVVVRFGCPFQENDYYICEYEITISGESEAYHIIGIDSLQALQLAMFMAGSALESTHGTSNWSWNGEPRTGLPSSLSQPIFGSS
jgi:hypothetical protein